MMAEYGRASRRGKERLWQLGALRIFVEHRRKDARFRSPLKGRRVGRVEQALIDQHLKDRILLRVGQLRAVRYTRLRVPECVECFLPELRVSDLLRLREYKVIRRSDHRRLLGKSYGFGVACTGNRLIGGQSYCASKQNYRESAPDPAQSFHTPPSLLIGVKAKLLCRCHSCLKLA